MRRRRAAAIGVGAFVAACFSDQGTNGDADDDATSGETTAATTGSDGTSTSTSTSGSSSLATSSSTSDPVTGSSTGAAGWRQRLEIDTADLGERLGGVPVLVRLTPDRLDYDLLAEDGSDLRVYDEAGAQLPFEIEQWEAGGESVLWVRVQELRSDEPAAIVLGYGEPAPQPPDPTGVWSAGYVGVWHFSGTLADSTAFGFDFTPTGTAPADASGAIGRAVRFQVDGDELEVADDDLLDLTDALTVEAWVMPTVVDPMAGNAYVERKGPTYQLMAAQQVTGAPAFVVRQSDGADVRVDAAGPLAEGAWAWLAGTFGGAGVTVARIVVDDLPPVEVNATAPLAPNTSPLRLGGPPWLGGIDELRISDVARSPAWLRFQYRSMTDQVLTYGPAEPL